MIKATIEQINTIITDSGLIDQYGGYSRHEVKDGNYFGYSLMEDCKGNIYGLDENVPSSGYIHLVPLKTEPNDRFTQKLNYEIRVELFAVPNKLGYEIKYYQKATELQQAIWTQLRKDNRFTITMEHRDHASAELSTIIISVSEYIPCDYSVTYPDSIDC